MIIGDGSSPLDAAAIIGDVIGVDLGSELGTVKSYLTAGIRETLISQVAFMMFLFAFMRAGVLGARSSGLLDPVNGATTWISLLVIIETSWMSPRDVIAGAVLVAGTIFYEAVDPLWRREVPWIRKPSRIEIAQNCILGVAHFPLTASATVAVPFLMVGLWMVGLDGGRGRRSDRPPPTTLTSRHLLR